MRLSTLPIAKLVFLISITLALTCVLCKQSQAQAVRDLYVEYKKLRELETDDTLSQSIRSRIGGHKEKLQSEINALVARQKQEIERVSAVSIRLKEEFRGDYEFLELVEREVNNKPLVPLAPQRQIASAINASPSIERTTGERYTTTPGLNLPPTLTPVSVRRSDNEGRQSNRNLDSKAVSHVSGSNVGKVPPTQPLFANGDIATTTVNTVQTPSVQVQARSLAGNPPRNVSDCQPSGQPNETVVCLYDADTGVPIYDVEVTVEIKDLNANGSGGSRKEYYSTGATSNSMAVKFNDDNKGYVIYLRKGGKIDYDLYQTGTFTKASAPLILPIRLNRYSGGTLRTIIGFEQSGASATKATQNAFLNFFFIRPIPFFESNYKQNHPKFSANPDLLAQINTNPPTPKTPRLSYWADVRLTSVPQKNQNLFSTLTSPLDGQLTQAIPGTSELGTAFAASSGLQYRLARLYLGAKRVDFNVFGGFGFTTPLNSAGDQADLFKIPKDDNVRLDTLVNRLLFLNNKFGLTTSFANETKLREILNNKKQIAFVPQDRDRFLKAYFLGFRIMAHYDDREFSKSPAIIDISLGQDQLVTGGKYRGIVARFDGFFPLPLGPENAIYLFGSSSLAYRKKPLPFQDQLILPPGDPEIGVTHKDTFIFPVPQPNRDIFRFGIGIDFLKYFSDKNKKD